MSKDENNRAGSNLTNLKSFSRRETLKRLGTGGTTLALGGGFLSTQADVTSATHNCEDLDTSLSSDLTTDEEDCYSMDLASALEVTACHYTPPDAGNLGHHEYLFSVYGGAGAEIGGSETDAISYQELEARVCNQRDGITCNIVEGENSGYWPATTDEPVQDYFIDLAGDVATELSSMLSIGMAVIEEVEDINETFLTDANTYCDAEKYDIASVERGGFWDPDNVSRATQQFNVRVEIREDITNDDSFTVAFEQTIRAQYHTTCGYAAQQFNPESTTKVMGQLWPDRDYINLYDR